MALGDGGIARPSLGVLAPLFCRLPGMGGRSKGAGEDIFGGFWIWCESGVEDLGGLAVRKLEQGWNNIHIEKNK